MNATSTVLSLALQSGVPALIWGPPGTGKSSAMRALAQALGLPIEVVIASIREPSDFNGLPAIIDRSVTMVPPDWAQRLFLAGKGIAFFDEISTAAPAVQAGLLRVVLEKVVGSLALPPTIAMAAAANPPEQAAGGWELCVSPKTKVLRTDLLWVEAGELQVGDDVVGIDEHSQDHIQRRLRPARVEIASRRTLPCYEVVTTRGTVVVSEGHPFLVRMGHPSRPLHTSDWCPTDRLKVGDRIRFLAAPWAPVDSRDGGYLAAIFDGEGWVQTQKGRLGVAQNPGVVLTEIGRLLASQGYVYTERKAHKYTHRVVQLFLQDMPQILRLLGSIRPLRLLEQSNLAWVGRLLPWGREHGRDAVVQSVRPCGSREVVTLTTTTRTFIAEGLVSHNSAPLANRFWHGQWVLDTAVWVDGLLSGWPLPTIPRLPEGWDDAVPATNALVAGFVRARPTLMLNVPELSSDAGKAWPSPRTWEMASRLMTAATATGHEQLGDVVAMAVGGCVGPGPAGEFLAWVKELDLPDPEMILKNPDKFKLPTRSDRQFAVLASVAAAVVQNTTPDRWIAGWKVMAKAATDGPKDVAAAASASLLRLARRRPDLPLPSAEIKAFVPLLKAAGVLPS